MMMAMSWDPRIERRLADYPALRAIGQTPLVPVHLFREELPEVEVLAKLECLNPGGSLKDRPVLRMVLSALDDGRLRPGQTILDSSSGNAGIAYAMIGRLIGIPVEIVIPDNASMERKKRMRAHGAQLTVTDPLLGYDEALREVHRRAKTYGDRYFFCDQYGNDDNWRAHYETTAGSATWLSVSAPAERSLASGDVSRSTMHVCASSASSPRRSPASKGSSRSAVPRTSCRRSSTRASSTSACRSASKRRIRCANAWPRPGSSSDSRPVPTWRASSGLPSASVAGASSRCSTTLASDIFRPGCGTDQGPRRPSERGAGHDHETHVLRIRRPGRRDRLGPARPVGALSHGHGRHSLGAGDAWLAGGAGHPRHRRAS